MDFNKLVTTVFTAIGGTVGFFKGLLDYWAHFTHDVSYHLIDGAITTATNTIIGATLSYIVVWVFRRILPYKKEAK